MIESIQIQKEWAERYDDDDEPSVYFKRLKLQIDFLLAPKEARLPIP